MKIFLSVVLVLLALLSLAFDIDKNALELYYQSFDRAVYSFALAKGLNAVISVIQSSEINVSFFVGATVGLGEILDPLNDLVERFSWIMLASSVSIGIQHLLLIMAKTLFIKVTLLVAVVATLIVMWVKKLHNSTAFLLLLKIVVLLLVLRFGAVIFIYTNEAFYNNIYSQNYKSSTIFISEYKSDLEEIQKEKRDLKSYWEEFEQKMEIFSKKVIKLITIFVVTTVIFPLLFLWFFYILLKSVFNLEFDKNKVMLMLSHR
ncbi:hypothetical protein FJR48_07880 [Sulfurimonas lithotrophica]|uniref:Uncharacterized protein n=1 Tax=Sulfurimonas lithotrophica TaxID=2590022 RepID=A0A5P8P1V1_9BACT|nr:hypothetical protein [Sulfurimonas lithotrophica]QFR49654.1 hypothetical protein FJR48_07880 [Sulfurimonas lithotrophica]